MERRFGSFEEKYNAVPEGCDYEELSNFLLEIIISALEILEVKADYIRETKTSAQDALNDINKASDVLYDMIWDVRDEILRKRYHEAIRNIRSDEKVLSKLQDCCAAKEDDHYGG